LEPFEAAGVHITGLDELTGLPNQRHCGLLLDAGIIVPRSRPGETPLAPNDEWVVEWRALLVSLLDELAPLVRERLGTIPEQMPLVCILVGGTGWNGTPSLAMTSDGTVF